MKMENVSETLLQNISETFSGNCLEMFLGNVHICTLENILNHLW
jgi:hypothetical protein